MSDRINIQLAIGYGLGVGLLIGGMLTTVAYVGLSFVGIEVSVFIVGAFVSLGGVAIAVVNALRLDRDAI